jgi:hypothetical protein
VAEVVCWDLAIMPTTFWNLLTLLLVLYFTGDDNGRLKLVQAGQGRVTPLHSNFESQAEKNMEIFVRERPHTHTHFICV